MWSLEDAQVAQELDSNQNVKQDAPTASGNVQDQGGAQTYATVTSTTNSTSSQGEGGIRQNGSQENSQQRIIGRGTTQTTQGEGTRQNGGQRTTQQGNDGHGSFHEHVEDVYAERRRKNIILRGIPEDRCRFTNQQNDDSIIYEVLEALGCENAYDDMVSFNRLGKRLGKRLLMVSFNNERAVKFLLNRAPLLNRVRRLKYIYIMKDRPRSERPGQQGTNESNRLAEAAAGAINTNNETSGGVTAPANRVPNNRAPQNGNGESTNVNQGDTTRRPHDRRQETPNSRMETPNSRAMRFLDGIRLASVSLFGESPRRERRQETLAPGSAEQRNAQSGNGGVETQDTMG